MRLAEAGLTERHKPHRSGSLQRKQGARDDLDVNQSCDSNCHGCAGRAHFAASAAHEHGFGFIGHTIVGALAGALSGYFLQKLAVTVVTASGSLNEVGTADNAVLQGLTGLAAGGCLMLVVGFIKHSIEKPQTEKGQPEKN
jgi:hypothetical protein